MDRFYCPTLFNLDNLIIIDSEEVHHIIGVMRKSARDKIEVSDGLGQIVECEITQIGKNRVECRVLNRIIAKKEKPQFKFLAPVLKNPNRFEFMLEKLTELGVHEVIPFISEKSLKVADKSERWKKVLVSAMKQSHVDFLPVLHSLSKFDEFMNKLDISESVILHGDSEGRSIGDLESAQKIFRAQSIYVVVGPEGDFSNKERELLLSLGSIPVKLSKNRLRSETAGIVLLSLVKNLT